MKNIIQSAKDKIEDIKQQAENFFAEELMEKLLPKIKKLVPIVEKEVKKYLGDNERIIIIKKELNGDVSVNILDQKKIEINFKFIDPTDSQEIQKQKIQDAIVSIYSIEECAKALIDGNMEKFIKTE